MSMYSDHRVGALSDVEFHNLCVEENARERAYIDDFERFYEEGEEDVEIRGLQDTDQTDT